jgi:hypothetical protein
LHGPSLAIAVVVSMAIGIWVLRAIRRGRRQTAAEAVSSVNLPTNVDPRDGS